MYDQKLLEFKVNLVVRGNTKQSAKLKQFYVTDFKKPNIELNDAIVWISKLCLTEYYHLVALNDNKDVYYLIICSDDNVYKKMISKDNLWIDQLRSILEGRGTSIVFRKMEEKKCPEQNL